MSDISGVHYVYGLKIVQYVQFSAAECILFQW